MTRLDTSALTPAAKGALREYLRETLEGTKTALAVELDERKLRVLQGRAQAYMTLLDLIDT